jgi:hypothetical protein
MELDKSLILKYSFFKNYYKYSKSIFFINFFFFTVIGSSIIGNAALNINILIIFFIFIYCLVKKIIIVKIDKKYLKFFFALNIFLLLNIFFSINTIQSFFSYLGFLKNFLFASILYILLIHNNKNFKIFMNFLLFFIIFVAMDSLIQFFFLKDLFGYPQQTNHGIRLSGPFGYEYVVGAFLSKLTFILVAFFHLIKISWKFKYLFIVFMFQIIFLSGERSAFIMMFLSTVIFILLDSYISNLKKILIYFILFLFFLLTIIISEKAHSSKSQSLFSKYSFLFKSKFEENSKEKNRIDNNPRSEKNLIQDFFDTRHGAHFLTGFHIFLSNPYLGSGLKTFRIECSNEKYSEIKSLSSKERCNTHPHNIYIELLSELGSLGFIIFFSFIFYVLLTLIKIKNLAMLGAFLIFFFPLQTTGAFFSSFNGFFYYIFFTIFFYYKKIFLNKVF